MQKLEKFYNKNYKILLFIPIILTIISLGLIVNQYVSTGDFIYRDVSLKGGISSSVYTDKFVEIADVQKALGVESVVRRLTDFSTGKQVGYVIEVSDLTEEQLKEKLSSALGIELNDKNFSIEQTEATLGKTFYKQLLVALAFAFLFISIVVFITFRSFIPSIAVIQAAFSDIVITLAIVNLLHIELSAAGFVAFLSILGYSIDTDILLTTRTLKRTGGTVFQRMMGSVKTGLTMTFASFGALLAGYIFTQSFVLKGIFLIILISLAVDTISTYLGNTGILMWYCRKKYGEEEQ